MALRAVTPAMLVLLALVGGPDALGAQATVANAREVAARSTDGHSIAAFPDVCKTPDASGSPPGVPVPYPNFGVASDTSRGTTKVRLANGDEIATKTSAFESTSAKTPNLTITRQGKVAYGFYHLDVKLPAPPPVARPGAGSDSKAFASHASGPPPASADEPSIPVLQTTDGQVLLMCAGGLLPANLFPAPPPSVSYVDPPPFEGPLVSYRSGRIPTPVEMAAFRADATRIEAENLRLLGEAAEAYDVEWQEVLASTAEQRAAVDARIRAWTAANPEHAGYPVRGVRTWLGLDGLYEGEITVAYGGLIDMYVARFDTEGNLLERPAMTPRGRAVQTAISHTPLGAVRTWVVRTDIHGNHYFAKVVYSNGGGYWMFNEQGKSYFGETFRPDTGFRDGMVYETRNYPVLSDRGEPLRELAWMQLATTRCTVPCQPFADAYNAIAAEMNLIIREMNQHAREHRDANASAQAAEAGYDQHLRAGARDNRTGPEPGDPVSTSVIQDHRWRYEALEEVLREFEPRLAAARTALEGCRCPDQAPDPLQTAALWGDPYLTRGPADAACLEAVGDRLTGGERCGQATGDCPDSEPPSRLPESCADSPLAWFFDTENVSRRSDDVTVPAPVNWPTGPGGPPLYPVGNDHAACERRFCEEWGLVTAYRGPQPAVPRRSQTGEPDPAWIGSGSIRPGLADQWGLRRLVGGMVLPEPAEPVLVALIDSGIDAQHPDLLGQLWHNPGEIPGNGLDDDGNGLVDDVNGWNFVADSNDVSDTNGHGTLVAGIVAARRNNGFGIAGINPQARLMVIKVTDLAGVGNSVDVAAAITYAANAGARLINLSLGGSEVSEAERIAIDHARSKDVLVVVAAGNQGADAGQFWPAATDGVLTVAATGSDDARAAYSNWGAPVDLAAPGSDILSLRARYTDPMVFGNTGYAPGSHIADAEGYLYYATGTSFAAPMVTGIASLLLSRDPTLDAASVRRMLLNSARDLGTPGPDILTGYGLLDGAAALTADPEFFLEARIREVKVARREGKVWLDVLGSADADAFATAALRLGAGETPAAWTPVGDALTAPVRDDVLASIDAGLLADHARWTLQLDVQHADGTSRLAQFDLKLR